LNRREFIGVLGGAAGALALPGCLCAPPCRPGARLAFQLGALHDYIVGKVDAEGKPLTSGAGLAKAFRALAAMGYRGIEFDDNYLNDAKTLKAMLADSGLVACGRQYGKGAFAPERIAEICEFEINYGNNLLVCADATEADVALLDAAVANAAKCGCRIAVRGNAATLSAIFARADLRLCAEMDMASSEDSCEFYEKFPHRSPTLLVRADEGTDWDAVRSVVAGDGVAWYVAASEPCGDLSAALSTSRFFRTRGIG